MKAHERIIYSTIIKIIEVIGVTAVAASLILYKINEIKLDWKEFSALLMLGVAAIVCAEAAKEALKAKRRNRKAEWLLLFSGVFVIAFTAVFLIVL